MMKNKSYSEVIANINNIPHHYLTKTNTEFPPLSKPKQTIITKMNKGEKKKKSPAKKQDNLGEKTKKSEDRCDTSTTINYSSHKKESRANALNCDDVEDPIILSLDKKFEVNETNANPLERQSRNRTHNRKYYNSDFFNENIVNKQKKNKKKGRKKS